MNVAIFVQSNILKLSISFIVGKKKTFHVWYIKKTILVKNKNKNKKESRAGAMTWTTKQSYLISIFTIEILIVKF